MKKTIENTINLALEEAEKKGFNIYRIRPASDHPDDWYLAIVMYETQGEFVTSIFNATLSGFHGGRYYSDEFAAIDNYKER